MVGIISCDDEPTLITPELAFQAKATTGEGAIWHPDRNTLFWVDIEGQSLYEYFPKQKDCHFWRFDRMVSAVVPETDSTMIVALQDEIIRRIFAESEALVDFTKPSDPLPFLNACTAVLGSYKHLGNFLRHGQDADLFLNGLKSRVTETLLSRYIKKGGFTFSELLSPD